MECATVPPVVGVNVLNEQLVLYSLSVIDVRECQQFSPVTADATAQRNSSRRLVDIET